MSEISIASLELIFEVLYREVINEQKKANSLFPDLDTEFHFNRSVELKVALDQIAKDIESIKRKNNREAFNDRYEIWFKYRFNCIFYKRF